MKKFVYLIIVILISTNALAQKKYSVLGKLTDTSGGLLPGIRVLLSYNYSKDSAAAVTDNTGKFTFTDIPEGTTLLSVTGMGLKTYQKVYEITGKNRQFTLPDIKMELGTNDLEEVVVISNPVTIKEDTIQYRADAYKVMDNAPVEDVIKKLPGVTVDKDGNITAQGKAVARVRVNGKDFFGGDVQTATQNLPANIIDNIQIIDDYGDQANITGIKTGEPEKVININIQKGKNKGVFGDATVAAGNEGRYMGALRANQFKEEKQLSLIGNINNTNANTFNFNGGGRGGGARGANLGGGERGGGGSSNGITLTKSLGLNYRDKWGEKISVYGSYSLSQRNTSTQSNSLSQDYNPSNIRTTNRTSATDNSSTNHRITWNMEYTIDTANYLKVSPYLSLSQSGNSGTSNSEIYKPGYTSFTNSKNNSNAKAPNAGGTLLYIHKFSKKGRNISLSASEDYSDRNANQYNINNYENIDSAAAIIAPAFTYQHQHVDNANSNFRTVVSVTYSEPLGKNYFVDAGYTWNRSASDNNRMIYNIDSLTGDETMNKVQSNHYNFNFTTNRYSLSLRSVKEKYNYSIGLVAQPSALNGEVIGKPVTTGYRNFNLIPSGRFVYKFSRSNTLTANYQGSSNEPNFTQLQPITDSTNLNNLVIGNPNLKADFTHRLSVQYNRSNPMSGDLLFANLSVDETQNKIVSQRFNNTQSTSRTTTYRNTNGFYGVDGNISYTKPFAARKFSVTVATSGTFDNNISYTDSFKNNGQNWLIRPSARFHADINYIIDADLNLNYTARKTINNYATGLRTVTDVQTLQIGLSGKNYFWKNWTLGYDLSKNLNYGYSSSVNSNPMILNMYFERRFLKGNMATLRFQAFDLLNENTGITRTVIETTVTDSRSNRLARYYLLSFNLRLQKFSGKRPRGGGNTGDERGGGNGGGRGNGGGGRGGRGGGMSEIEG